uniref:Uncharacterized protein n=1 Tax=Opuntia streptacantha TaxID=393608 RepID=A0A7C9DRW2_OPUST
MSSSVASIESNTFSFTGLMTSPLTDFFAHNDDESLPNAYQNHEITNTTTTHDNNNRWGGFEQLVEVPKFKSLAPASLSVSHHDHHHDQSAPPVSPSSFFTTPHSFSPSIFLDSPILNVSHSPFETNRNWINE